MMSGDEATGEHGQAPPENPAGQAPREGEQEQMTFFQALSGVFAEPSRAFPFLVTKSAWVWFPLVCLMASSFFSSYLFISKVDKDAALTQQLRTNKFLSRLDAQQVEEMRKRAQEGSNLTRPIIGAAATPIILALAALVYYLCFLALGGNLKYGQAFLVVTWSKLTVVIANVLAAIIVSFKNSDQLIASDPFGSMEPKTVLLSNLGNLIGAENLPASVFVLLSSFDAFVLWYVALLIIGFSSVAKVSRAMSATVVLAIFALLVSFGVAMAFFFMQ